MAHEDGDNSSSDETHGANATLIALPRKTSIHASFDRDVVEFFKGDGRGHQTRMNAVWRRSMEAQQRRRTTAR